MRRLGARIGLWGLLLLLPLAALARDAIQWLEAMAEAMERTHYRGTFVYAHDGRMEAMEVVHRAADGPEGEARRLFALSGAAREVISDDAGVTCILPDAQAVMVDTDMPRTPLADLGGSDWQRLAAYYEFLVLGEDRMAGLPAQIVAVRPRDDYRYGYRLWLWKANALPLKFELLSPEGEPLEQMMFTHLEVMDAVPDEALLPSLDGESFKHFRGGRADGETVEGKPAWTAGWLPDGFSLIHHNRHRMPMGKQPVDHLVYGDGLATLSVYVEPSGADDEPLRGSSHMGAVNAIGLERDGRQVTVVGAVPAVTVRRVGESVRPRDD
ncbi:MAG TPA: hypothetical protein ENJ05_07180 [Thiotrichales bacterium]|nr:hypothetical protein [Thiotrichales bacterium]